MSKNKKFSSFKKQQVLTENWRSFLLGEQTVEVLPPDYEFLDDDDKSIPVRTKDDAPIDLSGGITDDKGKKKKKKIHRPLDVDEYYRKMMMSDESEQDWEEYQVRGWDPEKHRTGELRTKGPKWAGLDDTDMGVGSMKYTTKHDLGYMPDESGMAKKPACREVDGQVRKWLDDDFLEAKQKDCEERGGEYIPPRYWYNTVHRGLLSGGRCGSTPPWGYDPLEMPIVPGKWWSGKKLRLFSDENIKRAVDIAVDCLDVESNAGDWRDTAELVYNMIGKFYIYLSRTAGPEGGRKIIKVVPAYERFKEMYEEDEANETFEGQIEVERSTASPFSRDGFPESEWGEPKAAEQAQKLIRKYIKLAQKYPGKEEIKESKKKVKRKGKKRLRLLEKKNRNKYSEYGRVKGREITKEDADRLYRGLKEKLDETNIRDATAERNIRDALGILKELDNKFLKVTKEDKSTELITAWSPIFDAINPPWYTFEWMKTAGEYADIDPNLLKDLVASDVKLNREVKKLTSTDYLLEKFQNNDQARPDMKKFIALREEMDKDAEDKVPLLNPKELEKQRRENICDTVMWGSTAVNDEGAEVMCELPAGLRMFNGEGKTDNPTFTTLGQVVVTMGSDNQVFVIRRGKGHKYPISVINKLLANPRYIHKISTELDVDPSETDLIKAYILMKYSDNLEAMFVPGHGRKYKKYMFTPNPGVENEWMSEVHGVHTDGKLYRNGNRQNQFLDRMRQQTRDPKEKYVAYRLALISQRQHPNTSDTFSEELFNNQKPSGFDSWTQNEKNFARNILHDLKEDRGVNLNDREKEYLKQYRKLKTWQEFKKVYEDNNFKNLDAPQSGERRVRKRSKLEYITNPPTAMEVFLNSVPVEDSQKNERKIHKSSKRSLMEAAAEWPKTLSATTTTTNDAGEEVTSTRIFTYKKDSDGEYTYGPAEATAQGPAGDTPVELTAEMKVDKDTGKPHVTYMKAVSKKWYTTDECLDRTACENEIRKMDSKDQQMFEDIAVEIQKDYEFQTGKAEAALEPAKEKEEEKEEDPLKIGGGGSIPPEKEEEKEEEEKEEETESDWLDTDPDDPVDPVEMVDTEEEIAVDDMPAGDEDLDTDAAAAKKKKEQEEARLKAEQEAKEAALKKDFVITKYKEIADMINKHSDKPRTVRPYWYDVDAFAEELGLSTRKRGEKSRIGWIDNRKWTGEIWERAAADKQFSNFNEMYDLIQSELDGLAVPAPQETEEPKISAADLERARKSSEPMTKLLDKDFEEAEKAERRARYKKDTNDMIDRARAERKAARLAKPFKTPSRRGGDYGDGTFKDVEIHESKVKTALRDKIRKQLKEDKKYQHLFEDRSVEKEVVDTVIESLMKYEYFQKLALTSSKKKDKITK